MIAGFVGNTSSCLVKKSYKMKNTHRFSAVVNPVVGHPPGNHGVRSRTGAATLELVLSVDQELRLLGQDGHIGRFN